MISLYLLVRAGYPFDKDDLTPQDWQLIGLLDATVRKIEIMNIITQYNMSIAGNGQGHE